MSGLPYANARLTMVQPPGASEDYDQTASAGTAKWTGELDISVLDEFVDQVAGGVLNRAKVTTLTIPLTAGLRTVALTDGDVLTYIQDGITLARTARAVTPRQPLGMVECACWDT